ncbi:MAG: CPBP family intramembrane glutamic endopeptidase [Actinocrinis sp.]
MDQTQQGQGQNQAQDVVIPAPSTPPLPQMMANTEVERGAGTDTGADGGQSERISPRRAFGELGVVYFVAFGLGVVSAVGLLTDPKLADNQQIRTGLEASSEIMQYVMQAAVVIFGVGYFSLRRGVTLGSIFGRFTRPQPADATQYAMHYAPGRPQPQYPYPMHTQLYAPPYSAPAPPGYQDYAQVPYQGYGYAPPQPVQRGVGWQFSRTFFLSLAGVLGFLLAVVIYVNASGNSAAAPDQGHSLWLIPVGLVVALCAGLGEEVLVTGMVVTTLEQAGFGKRAWVIYLVAIALRIPFHLYYGWAAPAVICFTVVNIWVYRRWRLLWPIVLAHALYDAVQFGGALSPVLAGLALLAMGLASFGMAIVIAAVELSERSTRRRFEQWRAGVGV